MISTELLRILSIDREREIEANLRVRALLGRRRPARDAAPGRSSRRPDPAVGR